MNKFKHQSMKRLFSVLIILLGINFFGFAQNETNNVTFFGSSVCKGSGAENSHGYAWQFFHHGAIDTVKYKYFNASKGGDNTIKVERDNRMALNLYPTHPDMVVIGLSLGNEGLRRTKDDNDREQILEQFRSRLLAMADSLNSLNIKPIIVNCYANSHFNKRHYEITKRMNRMINTWDYPSINVLGTIDDLAGKWVKGYLKDPLHPNTKGHEEMSYAIVPSLFEAISMGKKTPAYDWNRSYTTLKNDKQVEKPLSIEIESTMHSFTLSFRFKETRDGSIAGFVADGQDHTINVLDSTILYKGLSTNFPKQLKAWTQVVLSHSYANQKTMLFVNGELVGSVSEQLSPTQVYFGGTAQMTELKDIALHRSSVNESEALDLFNKKFIQSSLEFYHPLTRPIGGNHLGNLAQSMTQAIISQGVALEYKLVAF